MNKYYKINKLYSFVFIKIMSSIEIMIVIKTLHSFPKTLKLRGCFQR